VERKNECLKEFQEENRTINESLCTVSNCFNQLVTTVALKQKSDALLSLSEFKWLIVVD
jgi:plasmid rolling circle replication initiator protein Rep